MLRFLAGEPRRILIVRLGAIGDVARVLPMLNGLRIRFPRAEIDWIVQSKAAGLLQGHPQVSRLFVVPYRRWSDALTPAAWRLRRRLRARAYDLVLDFQGMLKGAVWALAAGGAAVRVGWGPGHASNLSWLWYHGVRAPAGREINRHLRHRSLVDWLDVPDVPAAPLRFDSSDAAVVERFVARLGSAPRPWILAYPGSSTAGSHKRWEPARLERALTEVRERTGGTVLIGWGPAEEGDARALARSLGAMLIPATSIGALACLIGRCDLFIGMDTGPMHLAGLVGTPVVAVFGRSSPRIHGPAGYLPGRAVSAGDAREWSTRERAGLGPFTGPEPGAVVEAALELLAESREREESPIGRR